MTRDEWLEQFGNNLQELLIEREINQRALSRKTRIPTSSISAYANGTMMPSAEAIVKISYAIDVDLSELIDFGETID